MSGEIAHFHLEEWQDCLKIGEEQALTALQQLGLVSPLNTGNGNQVRCGWIIIFEV